MDTMNSALDFHVVFHIDEIIKWRLLLNNVENLLDPSGEDTYSIIVLANGEAVRSYVDSDLPEISIMKKLYERSVSFIACNNSLKGQEIKPDDLMTFVEVVPAGVRELVKLQHEGYSYIKP